LIKVSVYEKEIVYKLDIKFNMNHFLCFRTQMWTMEGL